MQVHEVRTYRSEEPLPREQQLAWKIAEVAADPVAVEPAVTEMIVNRVIDNAAVAVAALDPPSGRRRPRPGARASRTLPGAAVTGLPARRAGRRRSGRRGRTASRFASSTSTTPSSPPSTPIPATTSRRSSPSRSTAARRAPRSCAAIATGYEIQVDLVAGDLPARAQDRPHRPPRPVGGRRPRHAARPADRGRSTRRSARRCTRRPTTRQCRKGEISTWKAYAPAFAGKMAIEAVDRAMRGEGSPSPIYEGEDGVIAWLLDGPDARYEVPLPEPGEPSGRSSTPTPRSTRPSTRPRR